MQAVERGLYPSRSRTVQRVCQCRGAGNNREIQIFEGYTGREQETEGRKKVRFLGRK